MENILGRSTEGEGVRPPMLEKLRKLWKGSAPGVVFIGTLVVCMGAVSAWVLNRGNPIVDYPDDIWAIRIGLVVLALVALILERRRYRRRG